MTYNLTTMGNSTNFMEVVQEINILAEGKFIIFILLIIFLITLALTRNYPGTIQFLSASFLISIIAAIFFALQMAALSVVITCIVIFLVSLIAAIWNT